MDTLEKIFDSVDGKNLISLSVHCEEGDYWAFSATSKSSKGRAYYHKTAIKTKGELINALLDFLIDANKSKPKAPSKIEEDFLS